MEFRHHSVSFKWKLGFTQNDTYSEPGTESMSETLTGSEMAKCRFNHSHKNWQSILRNDLFFSSWLSRAEQDPDIDDGITFATFLSSKREKASTD